MSRTKVFGVVVAAAVTAACGRAIADSTPFTSVDFWDGVPHTLIDFETEPDGTPIVWPEGDGDLVDWNLFSPLGANYIGSQLFLGNDPDPGYEAVLSTIGSLDNAVFFLGSNGHRSGFGFPNSVSAFSISFIVNEVLFEGGFSEIRILRDNPSSPLDQILLAKFTFDDFITQRIDEFAFGVIGFASDGPIDAFTISADDGSAVSYDDLRFSQIPSPGGVVVLVGGVGLLGVRRRRG